MIDGCPPDSGPWLALRKRLDARLVTLRTDLCAIPRPADDDVVRGRIAEIEQLIEDVSSPPRSDPGEGTRYL